MLPLQITLGVQHSKYQEARQQRRPTHGAGAAAEAPTRSAERVCQSEVIPRFGCSHWVGSCRCLRTLACLCTLTHPQHKVMHHFGHCTAASGHHRSICWWCCPQHGAHTAHPVHDAPQTGQPLLHLSEALPRTHAHPTWHFSTRHWPKPAAADGTTQSQPRCCQAGARADGLPTHCVRSAGANSRAVLHKAPALPLTCHASAAGLVATTFSQTLHLTCSTSEEVHQVGSTSHVLAGSRALHRHMCVLA